MPINTADMDKCDPKCRCSYGPNANVAYQCSDPCAGGSLGEFNTATCDCEAEGECYGGFVTYTSCGGTETCFRNTTLRCEEALGGCPTVINTSDTSIYGCGPEDPINFNLSIFWQYPDGSLVTQTLARGVVSKIEANATITPLYATECISAPC